MLLETVMYYFYLAPILLKFHYEQTNCKWVDANSINMSNVTLGYNPIRRICSSYDV